MEGLNSPPAFSFSNTVVKKAVFFVLHRVVFVKFVLVAQDFHDCDKSAIACSSLFWILQVKRFDYKNLF